MTETERIEQAKRRYQRQDQYNNAINNAIAQLKEGKKIILQ